MKEWKLITWWFYCNNVITEIYKEATKSSSAQAFWRKEKIGKSKKNVAIQICRYFCIIMFYVPPARKLVFSLQLRVAQCCELRYRGMKCKNWTAHVPIATQWSTIFFLFFFFFVQRSHPTDKALYIWTAHASIKIHYYYTRWIKSKWPGLVANYQVQWKEMID